MGFTELLTIIFVLLKVFDVVSWPWIVVFIPEMIAVVIYIILSIVHTIAARKMYKSMRSHFDKF